MADITKHWNEGGSRHGILEPLEITPGMYLSDWVTFQLTYFRPCPDTLEPLPFWHSTMSPPIPTKHLSAFYDELQAAIQQIGGKYCEMADAEANEGDIRYDR